jgi:FkbM family methyltransferase
LRTRSLPGRVIELRSGLRIHLSEHPHDIISVFVVFVREDYGRVKPGSTVADIGANIGIFALYAAHSQAARVVAYEPSAESYSLLLRNIQANQLEHRVVARQMAVVGTPGEKVRFPVKSSMYNTIVTEDSGTDFEWVNTIGLGGIVAQLGEISLLKLDCEGAEYDILSSADKDVYSKIRHIRLEYHSGGEAIIDDNLARYGFDRTHFHADTATSGSLWYEKTSPT